MEKFVVVEWPEIQDLMDLEGFEDNAHLINDERGLDQYGSSAYFVNEEWLKTINELGDDDDDDDTIKQNIADLFSEYGLNIFGKFANEIADAISDEVVEEYKEGDDGDLQRAISYVILDRFDKLI